MKIIFLDFDGVLNSTSSYLYHKSIRTGFSTYNGDPNIISVFLINRIIQKGVKVVISSSHRIGRNINEIGEFLKDKFDMNITDSIVGMTPKMDGIRGKEIEHWLKNTEYTIDAYCIIDDSTDMLAEQKNNFVNTNPDNGFDFNDYIKTLTILDIPLELIL